MKYTVTVDGELFEIEVGPGGRAWVDQEPYHVDLRHVGGNGEYSLLMDHRSYEVHVADSDNGHNWVTVGGRPYRTQLYRGKGHRQSGGAGNGNGCGGDRGVPTSQAEMRAPLPGLLVELRVSEGEAVDEQQVVAVLESMKMNLELRAPREGVVRELRVEPGRQVRQDEVLAVLGSDGASCSK